MTKKRLDEHDTVGSTPALHVFLGIRCMLLLFWHDPVMTYLICLFQTRLCDSGNTSRPGLTMKMPHRDAVVLV